MAILKVIHNRNSPVIPRFIDGKYHDDNSLYDVIAYCCRSEKIKSGFIGGYGITLHDVAAQMDRLAQAYGKADGVRLRHTVLSFQEGEKVSPPQAYQIAYQVAYYYGQEYQIFYAVHEDKPTTHIHFVMNTVSYCDGHKYEGKREDYYRFRQFVANILRPYGITVELR